MAKFDLITKMTLNAAGYDKGINKAKKKTEELKKTTQKVSGAIKQAMSFVGIGLGIAAVMKGVKDSINSVQSSGDNFHNTMEAAKEATNALFQSIATLSFGDLIDNLKNAARAGREYAEALDDVSDRQRSITISSKETELAIKKLESQLTNLNLTKKARQKIVDEVNRLTLEQFYKEEKLANQRLEAEKRRLKSKHNLSKEEVSLLINYIKNYQDLTKAEHDGIGVAIKAYKEYERVQKGREEQSAWQRADRRRTESAWDDAKKDLSEQELAYVMLGDTINKVVDKERDQIGLVLTEWIDIQLKLQKFWNKAEKGQQTIDQGNKKNAETTNELKLAVIGLNTAVINTSKLKFMGLFDTTAMEAAQEKMKNFVVDLDNTLRNGMEDIIHTFSNGIGELLIEDDFKNFGKKMLEGVANFMSNLASQMITFAMMSKTFAGIIKTIKTFMISNPIVAFVAAGALLVAASAFRTKANQPIEEYATGGILGGTSYTGDRIPFMGNSGEMILNRGQQNNLFDMINSGGGNGGGNVVFRIDGDTLVGVLNNNNRKRNSFS